MSKKELIKKICVIMAVCLTAGIISGCGKNQSASSDINNNEEKAEAAYQELISKINSGFEDNWNYGLPETLELSNIYSYGNSEGFGYAIQDINSDGIKELLIGNNYSDADAKIFTPVYDIFTYADNKLIKLATGGERDRYYLTEDNLIAEKGSNSAFNSFYAYYDIKDNALSLREAVIYDGFYNEKKPWFYSKTSIEASDAESISESQSQQLIANYEYVNIDFTPFENQING